VSDRLDALLARAAAGRPDGLALRTPWRRIGYGELDRAVTGLAAGLARLLGGAGHPVAVVNPLDPAFATAYYAVARSGNTVVIVNPFLTADGLCRALSASRARAAIVTPGVLAALRPVRERLPDLTHLILLDGSSEGLPTVTELSTSDTSGWLRPAVDPGSLACVQFTSGTTGRPKGVRLTHRNLVVNAGQVAAAHRLDGSAVLLNHLPTFHPMHLNAAVYAAAAQVLCPYADPARAVVMANRYRATHLYSLPVRLARLAADARLPRLGLDTVTAVLSGGSPLPHRAADALRARFGVPVVQGYGLAEMSPLTHADSLTDPTPGSVGPPVRGTGCRVVDVRTRRPVPAGERGEIQVRGPQAMAGYLYPADRAEVDAAGWLSTGDIGYVDARGVLFVVDRLKDAFKSDGWLVAPAEIEEVLCRHPAVVDCAVVDLPDPTYGAVAGAAVVLRDGHDPAEFERIIGRITEYMSGQPGFIEHRLLRCVRRPQVYVEMARWNDADSHRTAMQGQAFRDRVRELSTVATADPDLYSEVD